MEQLEKVASDNSRQTYKLTLSLFVLLVYYWMLIATPQIRFPVLGDIQLEKILVGFVFMAAYFSSAIHFNFTLVGRFLFILFSWALLSHFFSDYNETPPSEYWVNNYWKLMFVFALTVWVVNTKEKLFIFIIGISVILFLYQLHSWYDFINGGSYVFQQGVKRIVGVWSGGGIGAANGFGMLALFSVPFAIFIINLRQRTRFKIIGVLALLLACSSIIFSGTRGALLSLIAYFLIVYGRRNIKAVLMLFVAVVIIFLFLPENIQHRYTGTILLSKEQKQLSKTDRVAVESGESRLEGLKDGFKMALNKPILGYGPGSSGYARQEVREFKYENRRVEDETNLGLHSLYGQVISEVGFVGAIIFMLIIIKTIRQLFSLKQDTENNETKNYQTLIFSCLLILLIYGLFAHTLYRFHWILIFALASIYILTFIREFQKKKN